jgi:tRNA G18 (ribose-2'-O)-methylase SpoU
MSDMIQGRHAVVEALRAGTRLTRLVLRADKHTDVHMAELLQLAQEAHVKIQTLSYARCGGIWPSGNPYRY